MAHAFYSSLLALLLFFSTVGSTAVASTGPAYDTPVFYSVIYNRIPDEFDYPAVGLVNQSDGDFLGLELGLFNNHPGRVAGAQFGLINMVKSSFNGFQLGLLNAVEGNASGLRLGLINNGECDGLGIQGGFVNDVRTMTGIQSGIFNTARKTTGIQTGFVNSSIRLTGIQHGLINSSEQLAGVQTGLFNVSKTLYGAQIGIINVVDTIRQGAPIGLFSIVKKGGYNALEIGYSTLFPYNLSYKTGLRCFYTYPMVSYDPSRNKPVALGWGAGSTIALNAKFFANPEFQVQRIVRPDFEAYSSLRLNLGLKLNNRFELLGGPTLHRHAFSTKEELDAHPSGGGSQLFSLKNLSPGLQFSFRYLYR